MMSDDLARTTRARRAAELALVRVCSHYGGTPNFVLLGGLVPGLLCSRAGKTHAGTTDVDVQVDLEVASGAEQAGRLETALKNADFVPDGDRAWRWETTQGGGYTAVIKFELLTDRDDAPQGSSIAFDHAESLAAVNLRGTSYASRDFSLRTIGVRDQGAYLEAHVNVTGLAGFLMAKTAAAFGRHTAKDYYDIVFVLLNHDEIFDSEGFPRSPARVVTDRLGAPRELRSALVDLQANFADMECQGVRAYVDQHLVDYPQDDAEVAASDAYLAVAEFTSELLSGIDRVAD